MTANGLLVQLRRFENHTGLRLPAWMRGDPLVVSETPEGAAAEPDRPVMASPPEAPRGHRPPDPRAILLGIGLRLIAAGPLVVLLLLWAVFAALSPYFFTSSNLLNVLVQSCSVGLLALGALVVVMVGSLDLSLGASLSFCTVVVAVLTRDLAVLGGWIVVVGMLAGLLIGAVNSFVVVTLRIGNAFIVTLGMMYVIQSLALVVSGGSQVPGVPEPLAAVANGDLLGVPGPVVLVLLAGGLLAFFLNRVAWGRWIVGIGGNPDAAQKAGIPVRKVMFSIYLIAGGFTAAAAMVVAGLNDAGTVDSGGTSILLAIAAVVIGGASLAGGRGSVFATLIGALILATITNGLALLSVSPNWTPFAIGAVLVAAVILDAIRQRVEGRLRIQQAQAQGVAA